MAETSTQQHIDWLKRASEDPALRDMLLRHLGVVEEKPDPPKRLRGLPDFSTLSIMQVGFFDNGPDSKTRHALAIECWSCPPDDIVLKKRGYNGSKLNVSLFDYDEFPSVIKRHRGKMSQTWKNELLALHEGYGPDWLFGPLYVSEYGLGSGYIENQFIALHLPDDKPLDLLMANNGMISITGWDTELHDGKSLTGNCTYTARVELVEYRSGWATQPGNPYSPW